METVKVFSYSRFSSLAQGKGYSLERQVKRAEQWCRERVLVLEQSHADEGKSAYHAKHVASGALGRFLAELEAGNIPAGSILLIEQLDRLTRQNLHEAQGLVHRILDAGVKIVTIADGQEYTREQGLGGAVMLLVTLEAAHRESANKADRLKQSWQKRHQKATDGKIISRNVPGWIVSGEGKSGFLLHPERAGLVQEIFQLAADGMGCQSIAVELNRRGVPTWGRAKKWLQVSVYAILKNRAAIGELALKLDSKQAEAIKGYYPAAVDEALFNRVQRLLTARTVAGGSKRAGRTGNFTSVFSGVAICGDCGAKMVANDPGKGRGRTKLVCKAARYAQGGCVYHPMDYGQLEGAVLKHCREVDLHKLLSTGEDAELLKARARKAELSSRMDTLEEQLDGQLALAGMAKNKALQEKLAARLDALQGELDTVGAALKAAEVELDALSRSGKTLVQHVELIRELSSRMDTVGGDERKDIRRRLSGAITDSIESMTCYPNGLQGSVVRWEPKVGLEVVPFPYDPDGQLQVAIARLNKQEQTGREHACVLLRFRNGHSRLFRWDAGAGVFQLDSEDTSSTLIISGHDFNLEGLSFTLPDESGFKQD